MPGLYLRLSSLIAVGTNSYMSFNKINSEGVMLFEQPFARVHILSRCVVATACRSS